MGVTRAHGLRNMSAASNHSPLRYQRHCTSLGDFVNTLQHNVLQQCHPLEADAATTFGDCLALGTEGLALGTARVLPSGPAVLRLGLPRLVLGLPVMCVELLVLRLGPCQHALGRASSGTCDRMCCGAVSALSCVKLSVMHVGRPCHSVGTACLVLHLGPPVLR